ncbi:unnamed protein product [Cunninghamella echinulata]
MSSIPSTKNICYQINGHLPIPHPSVFSLDLFSVEYPKLALFNDLFLVVCSVGSEKNIVDSDEEVIQSL